MEELKRVESNESRLADTSKFAEIFSKLPNDKKAVVVAFMNGMEVQRTIEENAAKA